MKSIIRSTVMLIAFTTLYSINVSAQQIATVISLSGKVTAKQGGTERALSSGSSINVGESIITKSDGTAEIKYNDGTQVTIQKNSDYETVQFNPQAEAKLTAKLNTGAIHYNSHGKKKAFIQTPVVALAIQGTQFKLIATLDRTYIDVEEGVVLGGSQLIGPSQKFLSGSFDRNQKFSAGSIPWQSYSSSGTSTEQNQIQATSVSNTVALANEVNLDVVASTSTNATVNSLVINPPTELAELIITCP